MKYRKPIPSDPELLREMAGQLFTGKPIIKEIQEGDLPIPPKLTYYWKEFETDDP